MTETCIDGDYTRAQPVGAPDWDYPFRKNGDRVTAFFVQEYWQTKATYVPEALKINHPDLPGFYLIEESKPVAHLAGLVKFFRTWSRIPQTQTVSASRVIPKPEISGTLPRLINGVLVTQPDENVAEYLFYSQVAVTADEGPPSYGISGGTYTPTIGGDATSAIAYDATTGTLQTALNALDAIADRSSVTVTGGPAQFNIQFAAWATASGDASGLTVSVGSPTFAVTYETPAGSASAFRQHVRFRIGSNGFITAGAFTITVLGEETAPLDFDCTTADVVSAVNALSVIGSGAVVSIPNSNDYSGKPLSLSGNYLDFIVTIPFPSASVAETLTPSGSATIVQNIGTVGGVAAFGWVLSLYGGTPTTRTITAPSHGITASDDIILQVGLNYYAVASGYFTVPTANTISLTTGAGAVFFGGTITYVGKANGNTYAADSPNIPVELSTYFYLPGVSAGITTAADIPLPQRARPSQLIAAIFSGATTLNYEVGEMSEWRDSPIKQLQVTRLNPQHLL